MRTLSKTKIKQLPLEVRQARKHLSENGYTYDTAAVALDRDRTHLALTLSGKRASKSLCQRILNLPPLTN